MTFDDWKTTPPDWPPCDCNREDCEECESREAAEDRDAWAVDMAIDEAKERAWDR